MACGLLRKSPNTQCCPEREKRGSMVRCDNCEFYVSRFTYVRDVSICLLENLMPSSQGGVIVDLGLPHDFDLFADIRAKVIGFP